MVATLIDATLDAIPALQFTVVWAGEGCSKPERLVWWDALYTGFADARRTALARGARRRRLSSE